MTCLRAVFVGAVLVAACHAAPTEQYQPPEVRLAATTVERLTADSLFLSITVSEQGGQLKRTASLTNRANRPHTVSWLPYCGDLIWLLLDPANPFGPPLFNASRVHPCGLDPTFHTLTAGETFAAPEWQVVTLASKFMGDSLKAGGYMLGILVGISDLPALLQVGPIEFVKP